MKLLLFGGTFDPPHKGHMNLLQAAIQTVDPDKVVIMPAGVPPHKAASATPARFRLEMCGCFKACHPNLEISDWEIRQGGKNYTVNTLEMLGKKYPAAELFLSVGSDMLTTFTTWREWQHVLQLATLVVQSRIPGDDPELKAAAAQLEKAGGHIMFAGAPAIKAASSDIRSGKSGDEILPETVLETARKYHLYGR